MSRHPRPAPQVRLSAQGCLRVAIVRALCVPVLAGSLLPVLSHAAPVGSAAWFAQAKAAQAQSSTTSNTANAGSTVTPIVGGAVSTPQQAQATAQRSMANLTKAMSCSLQEQDAQRAAQQ